MAACRTIALMGLLVLASACGSEPAATRSNRPVTPPSVPVAEDSSSWIQTIAMEPNVIVAGEVATLHWTMDPYTPDWITCQVDFEGDGINDLWIQDCSGELQYQRYFDIPGSYEPRVRVKRNNEQFDRRTALKVQGPLHVSIESPSLGTTSTDALEVVASFTSPIGLSRAIVRVGSREVAATVSGNEIRATLDLSEMPGGFKVLSVEAFDRVHNPAVAYRTFDMQPRAEIAWPAPHPDDVVRDDISVIVGCTTWDNAPCSLSVRYGDAADGQPAPAAATGTDSLETTLSLATEPDGEVPVRIHAHHEYGEDLLRAVQKETCQALSPVSVERGRVLDADANRSLVFDGFEAELAIVDRRSGAEQLLGEDLQQAPSMARLTPRGAVWVQPKATGLFELRSFDSASGAQIVIDGKVLPGSMRVHAAFVVWVRGFAGVDRGSLHAHDTLLGTTTDLHPSVQSDFSLDPTGLTHFATTSGSCECTEAATCTGPAALCRVTLATGTRVSLASDASTPAAPRGSVMGVVYWTNNPAGERELVLLTSTTRTLLGAGLVVPPQATYAIGQDFVAYQRHHADGTTSLVRRAANGSELTLDTGVAEKLIPEVVGADGQVITTARRHFAAGGETSQCAGAQPSSLLNFDGSWHVTRGNTLFRIGE